MSRSVTSSAQAPFQNQIRRFRRSWPESTMYPRQSIPSNTLSFDETWLKIKEIVEAFLYRRGVSRVQWQDLFFYVHNYACWTDHGGEDLRFHLQEMLQKYVKGCEKNIAYSDEGRLLDAYIAEWTNFSIVYNYLPMPFHSTESSVNQPGRPETKAKSVVKTAMLKCWRDNIFAKREPSIRKAALNLVESERLGEAINGELIVGVQESYVALFEEDDNPLETYECYFECNYIDQSANFYAQRAAAVMDENGVQTYMRYAEEKLNDEKQRCQRYLHSQTVPKLMRKLVDVLVVRFQEQLYAEFRTLIVNNHLDKMKQLFRLINQTDNGVNVLLDIIHEHIKSDGIKDMLENASTIVSDAEKYVEKLLAMFERFTRVISDAFEDDPRFLTTRDKAFQEVVNDTSIFKLELVGSRPRARGSVESRCPELLANFCDMMLRKSSVAKKLSCEEIEEKLNSVLRVLKYVQNRDVFMRCHKHHLTRRLILENSADQEKEEWMVGRLREYGMPADHIGKLQKMLQDIEINKDMNSDFKRSLGSNNNKVMSDTINIKILNSGAWDRNADEKGIVTLPREIEEMIPEVDHFYREKHSGRKLQWCPHLSHATITFGTVYGQYDLDVTTFQMAVLFCWNERADEKISLASLKLATEIPEVELNKTLLSLVAFPKSKQQILLCDCQSLNAKDFTESTNFWINTEFAIIKGNKPQKHGRMNIIGRLPLTMEQLNRKEHDEIITLRELRTQEAIVKIMKTRKNMTSAQLETELVEILKSLFLPSKRLVKEQIEWLIEHSYIRRKDDQINVFEYVS
ncbi:hypothetical protein QR680_005625 [Steinernema hermaphroditum]|uniref:Cullin-5 n=1 Tax=Steinernema hermaphroditum TaxID=289476 RepID=A0AA39HTT9_9BILA|nr:hypothetical protein QR680_005625 [Steinernema hermaphroditum]